MLEEIEVECGGVVFGRYLPPGKLEVNPILQVCIGLKWRLPLYICSKMV